MSSALQKALSAEQHLHAVDDVEHSFSDNGRTASCLARVMESTAEELQAKQLGAVSGASADAGAATSEAANKATSPVPANDAPNAMAKPQSIGEKTLARVKTRATKALALTSGRDNQRNNKQQPATPLLLISADVCGNVKVYETTSFSCVQSIDVTSTLQSAGRGGASSLQDGDSSSQSGEKSVSCRGYAYDATAIVSVTSASNTNNLKRTSLSAPPFVFCAFKHCLVAAQNTKLALFALMGTDFQLHSQFSSNSSGAAGALGGIAGLGLESSDDEIAGLEAGSTDGAVGNGTVFRPRRRVLYRRMRRDRRAGDSAALPDEPDESTTGEGEKRRLEQSQPVLLSQPPLRKLTKSRARQIARTMRTTRKKGPT